MCIDNDSSRLLTWRITSIFRTEGISTVWQKARGRLFRKPKFRRLFVLSLSLTDDLPLIEPQIPVEFEELTPADYDELIALRPYLTEEVIKLRLEAGHRFYVAKLNARIIHTRLVAIEKVYLGYLGIAFPLSPREVYFGEVYTVPEHRRKHINLASRSFVCREMRQLGYQRAVALIHSRNRPSLCSAHAGGFRKKGHVGFVEIFGIRRYFYWAKSGGFDCLSNAILVPQDRLVPAELQGQIW